MGAARIGRIVMKGNVAPIRPSLLQDVGKRQDVSHFVQTAHDDYVQNHGYAPDAAVLVLCGLKQSARLYWNVQGDSRGGSTSVLALAQAVIQSEIGERK